MGKYGTGCLALNGLLKNEQGNEESIFPFSSLPPTNTHTLGQDPGRHTVSSANFPGRDVYRARLEGKKGVAGLDVKVPGV